MRRLTKRCNLGNCPGIHDPQNGDYLLVVGVIADGQDMADLAEHHALGVTELAVRIPKDLLIEAAKNLTANIDS